MSKQLAFCSDSEFSEDEFLELTSCARFFCPGLRIYKCDPSKEDIKGPIIAVGEEPYIRQLRKEKGNDVFDLTPSIEYTDLIAWNELATSLLPGTEGADFLDRASRRFENLKTRFSEAGHAKCYLFGSGPQLRQLRARDWSEGIRVSSASLCLDPSLWDYVAPHIVLLHDSAEHFGPASFAANFRERLSQCCAVTKTVVLFPYRYSAIAQRELSLPEEQLIPIQLGEEGEILFSKNRIYDFSPIFDSFEALLISLGAAFSPNLLLWGFGAVEGDIASSFEEDEAGLPDMRSEVYSDLGWGISQKHYSPRVPPLFESHLEQYLSFLEAQGKEIEVLHPSGIAALEKRRKEYVGEAKPRMFRGKRRIALLMALDRTLDHEDLWYDYLRGHEDAFSLYVFSIRGRVEFARADGVNSLSHFSNYVLPTSLFSDSYNQVGLQRYLLEAAMLNRENFKFVLLSSMMLPMMPFDEMYRTLTEDTRSCFPYGESKELPEWIDKVEGVPNSHFVWSPIDCVLNRAHAQMVLDDRQLYPAVLHYNAPAVGYYATLLNQRGCLDEVSSELRMQHKLSSIPHRSEKIRSISDSHLEYLRSVRGKNLFFAGEFVRACDISPLREHLGLLTPETSSEQVG